MSITIWIKKPLPKALTVRLPSPQGQEGKMIFLPGLGMMDKSEQKELLAITNERNQRQHTEEQVEEQVERKLNGNDMKPSIRRRLETGKW